MYTVGSNMPGFMPDSDPSEHKTIKEAVECLLEDITHYLEDCNLDSRFSTDQVRLWSKNLQKLETFLDKEPQECNFYCGEYVFFLSDNEE